MIVFEKKTYDTSSFVSHFIKQLTIIIIAITITLKIVELPDFNSESLYKINIFNLRVVLQVYVINSHI